MKFVKFNFFIISFIKVCFILLQMLEKVFPNKILTIINVFCVNIQVAVSLLRVLLFIARPRTFLLGNIPNSAVYRNVEQYPNANHVPGILILEIDAPIYFANASYLRER